MQSGIEMIEGILSKRHIMGDFNALSEIIKTASEAAPNAPWRALLELRIRSDAEMRIRLEREKAAMKQYQHSMPTQKTKSGKVRYFRKGISPFLLLSRLCLQVYYSLRSHELLF